jgi:hypothetical protein
MSIKTRIITLTIASILFPLTGCEQPESATGLSWGTEETPGYGSSASSAERHSPTAVESAIALSDKYAKLSEEASALRQQNQALDAKNQNLTEDLQSCRSKLEQAEKAQLEALLKILKLLGGETKTETTQTTPPDKPVDMPTQTSEEQK